MPLYCSFNTYVTLRNKQKKLLGWKWINTFKKANHRGFTMTFLAIPSSGFFSVLSSSSWPLTRMLCFSLNSFISNPFFVTCLFKDSIKLASWNTSTTGTLSNYTCARGWWDSTETLCLKSRPHLLSIRFY